jgi:hypothetical protein
MTPLDLVHIASTRLMWESACAMNRLIERVIRDTYLDLYGPYWYAIRYGQPLRWSE